MREKLEMEPTQNAPIDECPNSLYGKMFEKVCASKERPFFRYNGLEMKYDYALSYFRAMQPWFGQKPQQKVVTLVDKTPEAYALVWGLLFYNQIWTPLSAEVPFERHKLALEALRPDFIFLNIREDGGVASRSEILEWAKKNGVKVVDPKDILDIEALFLEKESTTRKLAEDSGALNFETIFPRRNSKDLAYILFTSGSTGIPKGVPLSHGNLIPFLINMQKLLQLSEQDVFADFHEWAFDISIFYLYCAPGCGGAIVPARTTGEKQFPIEPVRKNGVTVWATVPSSVNRIQAIRPHTVWETSLRVLFICGEVFTLKTAKYIAEKIRPKRLFNFYGLTESAVENFYFELPLENLQSLDGERQKGIVPIGHPLPYNFYQVDQENLLWISGPQIFEGYLAGTFSAELLSRWKTVDGVVWFCTGDVVEVIDDQVYVRGRADNQIKLNGYRIELGEIEVQIEKFPGIIQTVCFVAPAGAGLQKLVAISRVTEAFLVENQGGQSLGKSLRLDLQSLREFLRGKLPEYMIPKEWFGVTEFPVNSSGKTDRKRLNEIVYS